MESKNKTNFFTTLINEFNNLLKNPKKLIPTFVLCGIWLVFSMISGFGVNIPILRFFYTLTYANGGMFGGFLGMVGGIFGKAVFAMVVNSIVLSICEKKNFFSGLKKGINGIFADGMNAVAPFFIGGGIGLLLYWFFNITSSPVNCAVAVVAAVGALSTIGKKNSILFSIVFWVMSKLSGGKTPSLTATNRVIIGFSLGFAVGLPITFVRLPILIVIFGVLLIVVGIFSSFVGKKRVLAAMFVALICISSFSNVAFASSDTYTLVIDSFYKEHKEKYGYHYNDWDSWMYYSFYKAGNIEVSKDYDGKYTFSLPGYSYSYTEGETNYSVIIPDIVFSGNGIVKDSNNETGYKAVFYAKLGDGISTSLISVKNGKTKKYIHDMKSFDLILSFRTKNEQNGGLKVTSTNSKCMHRSYPEGTENPDTYTYWSDSASHFSQGFTLYGFNDNATYSTDKKDEVDSDNSYVPYRGRLTYTSGRVNKYGQPFPDLMDFDEDGKITWADMTIQKELSHNPDYLDLPSSPIAIAMIALITAILGGGGAVVTSAVSSTIGSAVAEVLGSAATESVESVISGIDDIGSNIIRDEDGDLNITDPATGEKRLYKNNGDGTYTNPLTGATYTESELKSSLKSRMDNADTIRKDVAVAKEAVASQCKDNQGLSNNAKEYATKKAKQKAHDEYVEKLGKKYGVNSTNEDDIRAKLSYEKEKAEIKSYEYQEIEGEIKNKQEYVETLESIADKSVDVLADVTGRKDIKAGYTMAKNTLARTSEAVAYDKNVAVGIAQGALDGTIGVVQDNMDGATNKLVANVVGETYKEAMDATINDKNMTEAVMGGIGKGLVNTGVDVGMDMVGDGMKGMMGDVADDVIKNAMTEGAEVTKGSIIDGVKTMADDLIKDGLDEAFKQPGEE